MTTSLYSSDVERLTDLKPIDVTHGPVTLKEIIKPTIYTLEDFPDLAVELTDISSGLTYWRFYECQVTPADGRRYNAQHVWGMLTEKFGEAIVHGYSKRATNEGNTVYSPAHLNTPFNNITSVLKRLEETTLNRRRVSGHINMGSSSILAELQIAGFFSLYIDHGNLPDNNPGWHGSVMFGQDKYSFRIHPRGKVFQDVVGELTVRDEVVRSIEKFFAQQFWYLAHQPVFTLERTILPTAPWFGKGLLA